MILRKNPFRLLGSASAAAGRLMLKHEIPRDAAAISYFVLVALIPAVLVMVSLADAMLGWMDLHRSMVLRVIALFPGSRQFLRNNLEELTTPSPTVVVSCVMVALWSASWIFTFVENSINRAWGVSSQKTFWESRLRSAAFIALVGGSLLSSAAITLFIGNVRARTVWVATTVKAHNVVGWFWYLVLLGAGLLIAVLVFTLLFKWIPHRRVFWKEALAGAVATTFMWEIGSFIFARIAPAFDYQRIYGAMGAVIALLVWVYTSSLIMLFGANLSAQLHELTTEQSILGEAYPGTKLRRFPSR